MSLISPNFIDNIDIDNIDFNSTNYYINDDLNDDLCSFNNFIVYFHHPFDQIDDKINDKINDKIIKKEPVQLPIEIQMSDSQSELSQDLDMEDDYNSDCSSYSINYIKKSKKKIEKKVGKKIEKIGKKVKKESEKEIEKDIFNSRKDSDEEILKKTGLTKYELVNMNLCQIRSKFKFKSSMYNYVVDILRRHKNKIYARNSRLRKNKIL